MKELNWSRIKQKYWIKILPQACHFETNLAGWGFPRNSKSGLSLAEDRGIDVDELFRFKRVIRLNAIVHWASELQSYRAQDLHGKAFS